MNLTGIELNCIFEFEKIINFGVRVKFIDIRNQSNFCCLYSSKSLTKGDTRNILKPFK